MLPALLLCALSAADATGTQPPPTEPPFRAPVDLYGWHFAGLPIFSYGSDVGLVLGGVIFFYRDIPEHPNEHRDINLALTYATRGPRALDSKLDFRRLFGTSLRTAWNLHLGDDPQFPYWGEGADLGGLPVPPGYGTPPEPYRYHDRRLFASATLMGAFIGPLGWHLRARFLDVEVLRQGELLALSQPQGARGGRVALGEVGLWLDLRDKELNPHSGAFITAAAFVAPQLGGVSDFAFHGYDFAGRFYVPLWFGMTLAMRGLYDRKIAGVPRLNYDNPAVPFFERMLYEGIAYDEGLGGAATIRGIARFRISGDEKMLANVQLRANLLTTHFASKSQGWGIELGVDAGRAQQQGYPAVEAIGFTAGLRFLWDNAILIRVEVGRAPGGDNDLYLALGEQF